MYKRGLIWDEINLRLRQEMVGSLCNSVCKGILRRAVVSMGELSAPFWFRRTLPHNTMFCSPFLSDVSSLFNKNERLTRQKNQNVNLGRSPPLTETLQWQSAHFARESSRASPPPPPHPPHQMLETLEPFVHIQNKMCCTSCKHASTLSFLPPRG